MAKSTNLFIWSLGPLLGCVAFVAGTSGMFYFAIASDAHTWPYLSESCQLKWQATILFIAGAGIVAFIFLVFKEFLKRRNFDLDTTADEERAPEPWMPWLIKTIITYTGLFAIFGGGGLLSASVFNISVKLNWKFVPVGFVMILAILIMDELFRRWEWQRKVAAHKPSHLA